MKKSSLIAIEALAGLSMIAGINNAFDAADAHKKSVDMETIAEDVHAEYGVDTTPVHDYANDLKDTRNAKAAGALAGALTVSILCGIAAGEHRQQRAVQDAASQQTDKIAH